MAETRIFHFCGYCSPVNGREVVECGSDFPYCSGGHFIRANNIAKLIELEVELKETLPSSNSAQSRNGGCYEYRTYTTLAGGKEPAEETVPELSGQSSPVLLGVPAPTPEEQERMNKAVEAVWEVMERNASGLGAS